LTSGKVQDQQDRQTVLRSWHRGAIFLLSCAVLITRRPDAIFHAQFWAEDGHVWFADAYNLGWWTALFRTQDGYFQTLPRLGAALALLAPIALAPLVLNLIAITVQALPVNLLLASRSSAWGSLRFRAFLACTYLALPKCREIIAIITSSQWILTLCVFLLLVAATPKGTPGRLFDISILLLSGLTGPFCFFLLPIALFLVWRRGGRWHCTQAGVLAALSLVQAWGLLVVNPSGRAHAMLGANPALFVRIIAGHVYLASLLGGNGLAANSSPRLLIFLLCAAVGGTVIVAFCFAKSNFNMRIFVVLSFMFLAASFISPAAYPPPGVSRWQMLAGASGIRYWFFPTLVFAWLLLRGFQSRTTALKTASAVLLCIMCFGIIRDWRIPAFKDLNWTEDAKRFEAAPPGTVAIFPENPEGWDIRLVKR
jgi:hypothetical protein